MVLRPVCNLCSFVSFRVISCSFDGVKKCLHFCQFGFLWKSCRYGRHIDRCVKGSNMRLKTVSLIHVSIMFESVDFVILKHITHTHTHLNIELLLLAEISTSFTLPLLCEIAFAQFGRRLLNQNSSKIIVTILLR